MWPVNQSGPHLGSNLKIYDDDDGDDVDDDDDDDDGDDVATGRSTRPTTAPS